MYESTRATFVEMLRELANWLENEYETGGTDWLGIHKKDDEE